jgi:hypothetical protein
MRGPHSALPSENRLAFRLQYRGAEAVAMTRTLVVPLFVFTFVSTLLVAAPTAAPEKFTHEAMLKDAFEGRVVVVRIDMPATKDGVNVYPEARRDLDVGRYRDDLRRHGTALRAGETAVVTLVKVKGDLIEFQLNGGGYGTLFDDTDTSVHIPYVEKSDRERSLERRIRDERDSDRRRQMERELSDLRRWRERENDRIRHERERMSGYKSDRVAMQRMRGGSRFNIRFERRVPYGFGADDIMAALTQYVDFGQRWERPFRVR